MNWWGKLIGTGVGMFGGPLGALVGAAVGHAYDKGEDEAPDEKKARVLYLAYFFSCLAKVAKADGRVSESEIEVAESLMSRLALNEKMREFAINVFRKAKDGGTGCPYYQRGSCRFGSNCRFKNECYIWGDRGRGAIKCPQPESNKAKDKLGI